MASLVRHLHDFAREVHLTEEEWFQGIQFLTDAGHITDEKRQELVLLSDTLGLSPLVTALNNVRPHGCTEATVFGPFHVPGAPRFELGADIANGAPGEPCYVQGSVQDLEGRAIGGATIEVWQADAEGFYDVQKPSSEGHQARGVFTSGSNGEFFFQSILAEAYPIPHDGPVGKMLEVLGRHPWRPAHLHFMIVAKGYRRLITHIFRDGGKYLDSDAVFGVRSSLIAPWVQHEPGKTPRGSFSEKRFYTLNFDFVLDRES
jgi:hydroxyquinol 1,2-dioxygenase